MMAWLGASQGLVSWVEPWLSPPYLHGCITVLGTATFQVLCPAPVDTVACEEYLEGSQRVRRLSCASRHALDITQPPPVPASLLCSATGTRARPHQHTKSKSDRHIHEASSFEQSVAQGSFHLLSCYGRHL